MNCQNCNSNINQGESFCRVCGTKVQQNVQTIANEVNQNMQSVQQITQTVNNYDQPIYNNYQYQKNTRDDNNILIDAYIGKNIDKLKDGKFSFNVLFLGIIYVLYRKMWLLGLLWFISFLIVTLFLPSFSYILALAANVIIAINFKKWYLKHVEEKVEKIKLENQDKTQEQLIMICSQKGGTTIWPIAAFVIFYIMLVIFIFIFMIAAIIGATEEKDNKTLEQNNNSSNIMREFNNLSLTLPTNFKEGDYNSDYYESYSILSDTDYCRLSLIKSYSSAYDTPKEYLEKNVYSSASDKVSNIEEEQINGNTWNTLSVEKTSNTIYNYATTNNDEIYIVEFVIYDDETNICSTAHSEIINSLNFK